MMKRFLLTVCCTLALVCGTGADFAQAQTGLREAKPTSFDPGTHKRVLEISQNLRCLVCQNQTIADSNAELAIDLRNQVIEQVKAGKSDKEIIDYMVERYGDFVLYNPPFKMSTLILWLGPIAFFVIAVLALFINLKKRKRIVAAQEKTLTAEERARAQSLLKGE